MNVSMDDRIGFSGGTLAKQRAYKSEKRKKELLRQKKQEEKRQRRFKKDMTVDEQDVAKPSEETGSAS